MFHSSFLRSAGSVALLVAAFTPVGSRLAANEKNAVAWPSWRGPKSSGSAAAGSYASKWGPSEKVLWKVELPGVGRSTPAVTGEHILVTSPDEGQDSVLNFSWSGKLRWKTPVGKARPGKHRNGSGCNGSPVTDGKRVFAYFRSGNLAGLDLTGKLLWKTNLQERFGDDTLWWDIGTSPVLTETHVVVAVMHSGESYVAAFDQESGDLAWKVSRNYKTPTEGDHAYTTPIVTRTGGQERVLVWGAEHVTAHAADNGEVVWSCGDFNPGKKSNWVAVSSAVLSGDMLVVPYGRGSTLSGVKLGGSGDVTQTHRPWVSKDIGSFVPTPAAYEGKVYVLRDRGEVVCVDPATGKVHWKNRLPKHRASYYSSPMIADGKLYAAREDGVVFVARLGEKLEVLSENDMGEPVIASPVAVDGKLLLRSQRHLYCIE